MRMTTCDRCGFTDVRVPYSKCPIPECNGGVMYLRGGL